MENDGESKVRITLGNKPNAKLENDRNKMLRILIRFAASGRCFNRFYVSKRGLSFSIFNSPLIPNRFMTSFVDTLFLWQLRPAGFTGHCGLTFTTTISR